MSDYVERRRGHGRRPKIAHALANIINVYPLKNTFLYPILDTLLLFPQKPRIVSVYAPDSKPESPLYTSMHDPEIYPIFIEELREGRLPTSSNITVPGTNFIVSIHELDTSQGIDRVRFAPVSDEDVRGINDIFAALERDEAPSGRTLINFIRERIQELHDASRLPHSTAREEAPKQVSVASITDEEVVRLLTPMRRVLDDAYADFIRSPLMIELDGKPLDFPNIFCVIQNKISGKRRGYFDYTARVMLSNSQAVKIKEVCGDDDCDALESPLGANVRSIADSAFASGLIDFSSEGYGEGRDCGSGSVTDLRRREAEQCVYSKIVPPEKAKVFYIPVHIGGVSWLSFFTLSRKEDDQNLKLLSWAHNFGIYETLIPRINERVRAGVKRIYLALLGETLTEELERNERASLLDRVNKAWDRLTLVYPHRRVRMINAEPSEAGTLNLPDDSLVRFELSDNLHYERQIEYDLLDEQSVFDECRNVLRRANEKQDEVNRRFKAEVLSQRHTIFNNIPLAKLKYALSVGDAPLPGEPRELIEDAKKVTEILNASLWIALKKEEPHPQARLDLAGLLRWLAGRALSNSKEPRLNISPDYTETFFTDHDFPAAFTVLWNLWHNASKTYHACAEPFFTVEVVRCMDGVAVAFTNEGVMGEPEADFLRGKTSSRGKRPERAEGLQIIRDKMQQLKWKVESVETEGNHTSVTILIPDQVGPPMKGAGR